MVALTQTSQSSAEIHWRDKDYTLASYQNVFVVIWHDQSTTEAVLNLQRLCRELSAAWPGGIFGLAIVEERSTPPDSEGRAALASILRDHQSVLATAVVLDGTGFRVSFVRSVATGVTLLARQATPLRVCSMAEAARLFSQAALKAGTQVDSERLSEVVADLRRTIAASS